MRYFTLAGLGRLQRHSNKFQTSGTNLQHHLGGKPLRGLKYSLPMVCCRIQCFVLDRKKSPTMSHPTLLVRDGNIRPRQCQTPRLSCETTISGPDNARPHAFSVRLQYQGPSITEPTPFVQDYNIRPHQCQTPRFSCETTISGPDNARPHAFSARLQYQAPSMPDPTLFVGDYNIRSRQCQTPHFWCTATISGPNNVRPYTFRGRLEYQDPNSVRVSQRLFMRGYNNITTRI